MVSRLMYTCGWGDVVRRCFDEVTWPCSIAFTFQFPIHVKIPF